MTRVLGCDISSWSVTVDFNKMKSAGASFVYAKASQLAVDPTFPTYWKGAKGILPRGAFHYLDWHTSEMAQAKLFTDALYDPSGDTNLQTPSDLVMYVVDGVHLSPKSAAEYAGLVYTAIGTM